MKRRPRSSGWARSLERSWVAFTRQALKTSQRQAGLVLAAAVRKRTPPAGDGAWLPGIAVGGTGARRFRIYRPSGVKPGERLPLLVMLHGCGQDAKAFAESTRMNRVADRERFLVLYPEQDRLANAQGCWSWFDTRSGRADGESALIMLAIDQACLLHPIDRERVAIAGLSAGASMAALVVTRHPDRFKALVMHSGIPPGTAHSSLSAIGAMYGHRATRPAAATPRVTPARWPPLLVIHGTADGVVSPHNGRAAAALWAGAAGANAGTPRRVQRGQRHPMDITDFKHRGNTVSTLVEVTRLAHGWSGGADGKAFADARGPDASRMTWAFAAKQFRG